MNRYDVRDEGGGLVTVIDREDEWEFAFEYNTDTKELLFLRESRPHRARTLPGANSEVQRMPSLTVYLTLEDSGYDARRLYD